MSTHSDTAVFEGSLSRGLNASAAPVEIRLGDAGLEMGSPGGPTVWLWPYHRLRSSVPLSSKSRDALITF